MSESYDTFYGETYGDLAGFAMSLVGDRATAEDLTQEAMVRVYVRWGLLREPRPYAYRIVSNLARDRWRRRRTEVAAFTSVVSGDVEGPDVTVLDAVGRLPKRLRDVVALHYYADLPVAEVAKVVRRPIGTVKRRLAEARALLAIGLEDQS